MKSHFVVYAGKAALFVLALRLGAESRAQPYHLVDLATQTGMPSTAAGINNSGQITGSGTPATSIHGFFYDGTVHDIPTLGWAASSGRRLNSAGWVTGSAQETNAFDHAIIYRDGLLQDLGTLGGRTRSYGLDINDAGFVTGNSQSTSRDAHAFLFNGTNMIDLGTLGGASSFGTGINAAGQVAGSSQTMDQFSPTHAFRWTNGNMQDLGTLGGSTSSASAINASGWVVGGSTINQELNDSHAFLCIGTNMIDLGTLGGNFSSAAHLNDAGTIVGSSLIDSLNQHAFVYRNGVMYDLNTLSDGGPSGWIINDALGINKNGQIVGIGQNPALGSGNRAILLDPVPSLAIAASGSSVTITWSSWATGAELHNTTNLTTPIVWSPVTNAVMNGAERNSATIPMGNTREYFRLMKQ